MSEYVNRANQIIKDNQHEIDTSCQLCFYALDKCSERMKEFSAEERRIAATLYVQEEKERMVKRAADVLRAEVQKDYEEIKGNLEIMRKAAAEMDAVLDVGPYFQNALSVVKALGKDMPEKSITALVAQFKGQNHALVLLKAAMESEGIVSTEHYFKDLIFNADSTMDQLDELAYRLAVQPDQWTLCCFGNELEKFAQSLGVKLSKRFRDIVDTSEALNQQIRAAAGLGTAD